MAYTFNPFTGSFDYYQQADGLYIRLDGTTNCTSRIPFDEGIQGQTGGSAGSAKETPFCGYYIGGQLYRTGWYWPSSGEIRFCADSGSTVSDRLGISSGANGITCYTNLVSSGGVGIGTSSNPWSIVYTREVNIRGDAATAPDIFWVPNSGDTFRLVATGGRLEWQNNSDGRIDIVTDGSGNVTLSNSGLLTTVSGNLTVAQTTTLGSLTGILKGASGVVTVASSSDILSAIGTIDISSNTNLAVTSPITLSGDTVGFDATANFTWSGTNLYSNAVAIKDDVKFYIGDNSQFAGNLSIVNDQLSTGNVLIQSENGFGGQLYVTGIASTIDSNFFFGNSSHSTYAEFGATLTNPIVNAGGGSDGLSVKKQSTSAAIRGLVVQAEAHSTSPTFSSAVNGLNSFAYDTSTSTTNFTVSTTGGAFRNRQVARHRGTGTVAKMSGGSFAAIQDASAGTTTEAVAVNIEVPSIGAGSTVSAWKGLNAEAGSISGTATNAYQAFISELAHGANRYEVWLDGGGGLFLREAGNQLYSSAAATWDQDGTTTMNFRIGGTVKAALTTSALTGSSGVDLNFASATIGSLAGDVRAAAGVLSAYKPQLAVFLPSDNEPPAASYATFDTRNNHLVLDFDSATDEYAVFPGVLDRAYNSTGVTVRLYWAATSATSGNVVWVAEFERIDDEGLDIDADSFASGQTITAAAPGTSGQVQYTDIAFTDGSQIDSLAVGEAFRLRITRDANNASDTMTGDAELLRVELRST